MKLRTFIVSLALPFFFLFSVIIAPTSHAGLLGSAAKVVLVKTITKPLIKVALKAGVKAAKGKFGKTVAKKAYAMTEKKMRDLVTKNPWLIKQYRANLKKVMHDKKFKSQLGDQWPDIQRFAGRLTGKMEGWSSQGTQRAFRNYVDDVATQTRRPIPSFQKDLVWEHVKKRGLKKLTKDQNSISRKEFKSKKDRLIREWERKHRKTWPRQKINGYDDNGNPITTYQKYDAHHVVESELGGPAEWWNIHPALNPDQHQKGIHRKGGPGAVLLKLVKEGMI